VEDVTDGRSTLKITKFTMSGYGNGKEATLIFVQKYKNKSCTIPRPEVKNRANPKTALPPSAIFQKKCPDGASIRSSVSGHDQKNTANRSATFSRKGWEESPDNTEHRTT